MGHESTQRSADSRSGEIEERREPAGGITDFRANALGGVSRTFALTVPQLPDGLGEAVANAYLLCRIADTIEDDPLLATEEKDHFLELFLEAVESGRGVDVFAATLPPKLSPSTLPADLELIRGCAKVLRLTHNLAPEKRRAIHRCVSTMGSGMRDFERHRGPSGLRDVAELEGYCYFVAGVVGEMLTEIFCSYSPEIEAARDSLEGRAVSFGIGLQMTNILRDMWDDLGDETSWLPRSVFEAHGYDLEGLTPGHSGNEAAFSHAMQELVGVAHEHLRNALDYTLAIPAHKTGIRKFLIWAVLLAVSTLGRISANPLFTSGEQVKVSRRRVAACVAMSNTDIRSNFGLTTLFNTGALGLPRSGGHISPTLAGKDLKQS